MGNIVDELKTDLNNRADSNSIYNLNFNYSIQFNSCLLMCKLNSPEANYKVSTSMYKETKKFTNKKISNLNERPILVLTITVAARSKA
jgi:hypothetical protein